MYEFKSFAQSFYLSSPSLFLEIARLCRKRKCFLVLGSWSFY